MKRLIYAASFCFFLTVFSTSLAAASTYGESTYGSNKYGASSTESDSNGSATASNNNQSSSSPENCTASPPGTKVPEIYAAQPLSATSLRIYFIEPDQPADKLVIQFGTESGTYQFGADNIGYSPGMRTFDVHHLQQKTKYYFQMRAGNGCAPGEWPSEFVGITSNSKSLVSIGGSSEPLKLEITDVLTESNDTPIQPEASDSGKVTQESESEAETAPDSTEVQRFEVEIIVKDDKGHSIPKAAVTLYSEPKHATTDENGIARFAEVEPGDHRVEIAYDGYYGEKEFTLKGNVEKFQVEITATPQNPFLRPQVVVVLGILILAIMLLIAKNYQNTREKKNKSF